MDMLATPTAHAAPSLRQPYDPDSDDEAEAGFGDETAAAATGAAALDESWGVGDVNSASLGVPWLRQGIKDPPCLPFLPHARVPPLPRMATGIDPSQVGLCVCCGFGRDETRSGNSVTIICPQPECPTVTSTRRVTGVTHWHWSG